MSILIILLCTLVCISTFLASYWLLKFVADTQKDQRRRLIEKYIGENVPAGPATINPIAQLTKTLLRLTPKSILHSLREDLIASGQRSDSAIERTVLLKWSAGLGFFILGLMTYASESTMGALILLVGPAIGFFVPDYILRNRASARNQKILNDLPRVIDLLNLCVQAGMSIEAGLRRVTQDKTGPLQEELARTLKLLELGQSKSQAFGDLASGKTKSALSSFANTFVRSDRLGIPVSGVLAQQSIELRSKVREAAKTQANKLPVKILFPLMLFFLPAVILIILGPAVVGLVNGLGAL